MARKTNTPPVLNESGQVKADILDALQAKVNPAPVLQYSDEYEKLMASKTTAAAKPQAPKPTKPKPSKDEKAKALVKNYITKHTPFSFLCPQCGTLDKKHNVNFESVPVALGAAYTGNAHHACSGCGFTTYLKHCVKRDQPHKYWWDPAKGDPPDYTDIASASWHCASCGNNPTDIPVPQPSSSTTIVMCPVCMHSVYLRDALTLQQYSPSQPGKQIGPDWEKHCAACGKPANKALGAINYYCVKCQVQPLIDSEQTHNGYVHTKCFAGKSGYDLCVPHYEVQVAGQKGPCASCGALPLEGTLHPTECSKCADNPLFEGAPSGYVCVDCKVDLKKALPLCRTHYEKKYGHPPKNPGILWKSRRDELHVRIEAKFIEMGGDPEHGGIQGYWDAASLYGCELPSPMNPCVGFADFYLTEILHLRLLNPGDDSPNALDLADRAERYHHALVDFWDQQFFGYYQMILGGELRHSRYVGAQELTCHSGYSTRAAAWVGWKHICDEYGIEAIRWACEMHDISGDGGVSGIKWGDIGRVLLARADGSISPKIFVDRCWSLAHNGGPAINKVRWTSQPDHEKPEPNPVHVIPHILGPAQASNPPVYPVLLEFASEKVRSMWRSYIPMANKYRRTQGIEMMRAEAFNPDKWHIRHTCEYGYEVYDTSGRSQDLPTLA